MSPPKKNKPTSQAAKTRKRRLRKWLCISLLGLVIIFAPALLLLPQIATKVIAQLTGDIDLETFEIEVSDVSWRSATLVNLTASDPGWRATAPRLTIEYHPWDLLSGQLNSLTLHNLNIELIDQNTTVEDEPGTDDPGTDDPTSPTNHWISQLPAQLAACPRVFAPEANLTYSGAKISFHKFFDLDLRQLNNLEATAELTFKKRHLKVALTTTEITSTLTLDLTDSDPMALPRIAEAYLSAPEPYLPEELSFQSLNGQATLTFSHELESTNLSGSLGNLRYRGLAFPVSVHSEETTFLGSLSEKHNSLSFRGDFKNAQLEIAEIPQGIFLHTGEKNQQPDWTTHLSWSEEEPFHFSGTLNKLNLKSPQHTLALPQSEFSNERHPFHIKGDLVLDDLPLPFDYTLLETPATQPNNRIHLGPTTIKKPIPLLALLALLAPQVHDLNPLGTLNANLNLLLGADKSVSGTIAASLTNCSAIAADGFARLSGLSGKLHYTIPKNPENSPQYTFTGTLGSLQLDTTPALDFPLAHLSEGGGKEPILLDLKGSLSDQHHLTGKISQLNLAHFPKDAPNFQLENTTLDIALLGSEFKATALLHLDQTPLSFSYSHQKEELPDNDWRLTGKISLPPTELPHPLTSLATFNDLFEDLTFTGTISSQIDFITGAKTETSSKAQFNLKDLTGSYDSDFINFSQLNGQGSFTLPAGPAVPTTWDFKGSLGELKIDTTSSLDFPLAHLSEGGEQPIELSLSGALTGTTTETKGSLSALTLTGEHKGEEVSFAKTSLNFTLINEVFTSKGHTHFSENKIPFTYQHTRQELKNEQWLINGHLNIPTVTLKHPITNGGAFSETAAGLSLTGTTSVTSKFQIGSDKDFTGNLDLTLKNGTLILPDEGPTLSGLTFRYQTPSLDTYHTTRLEKISINKISYGDLAFTGSSGKYQLKPNGDLTVRDLRTSFLGGSLTLDPFTYPDDDLIDYSLKIRFKNTNLKSLTDLFPAFDGSLSGRIDGVLPISRQKGSYLPGRGEIHLSPRSAALLRYNSDQLFTGGLDPKGAEFKRMKLAEDSLKKLNIRILSGRLFDPGDEDKIAVIRIQGQSATIKEAPPIHLNLNLFEPERELKALVDYFFKNREKLDFGL